MRKHYFALTVALILFVFFAKAFTSIQTKSSTWDETHYFAVGKQILTTGDFTAKGSVLHPPLFYYWHSLPLLFMDIHDEFRDKLWPAVKRSERSVADLWRGKILLSSKANENDFALNSARTMMILIGVFLGIILVVWARYLFGELIALMLLVLYGFSPNVLAHARLITPDIMLTFTFFGSVFFCYRYVKFFKVKDLVCCALFTALTLLSKYSGIIVLPLLVFWILISEVKYKFEAILAYVGIIFVIGLLFYMGDFAPFYDGFMFQYAKGSSGHHSYLMGQHSTDGWWYYYILTFLFKTPLVTIGLFAVGCVTSFVFFIKKLQLSNGGVFSKIRNALLSDFAFLILPVLIFFALFTVKHNQCIGLRYLLPVYPFIFLLCGYALLLFFEMKNKRVRYLLIGLLLSVYIYSSVSVYPHYLSYFNLVGGGENGYKKLVDSNLDWGQDLKGLAVYCRKNNINDISLSYFGSDTPARYGLKYKWLPSMVLDDLKNEGNKNYPPKGLCAISVTNLMGVYFQHKDIYRHIRENYKPIAKIGNSIFVYDIK